MDSLFAYPCMSATNRRLTSAAVAVLSVYTGADLLFVPYGIPREVHWALAGIVVDIGCKGGISSITDPLVDVGMAGVAGFAGAKLFLKFVA